MQSAEMDSCLFPPFLPSHLQHRADTEAGLGGCPLAAIEVSSRTGVTPPELGVPGKQNLQISRQLLGRAFDVREHTCTPVNAHTCLRVCARTHAHAHTRALIHKR